MLWQELLDKELIGPGCLTSAALLQDGVTLATSEGFVVSAEEFHAIVNGMQDASSFFTKGVIINGVRYIYLSGSGAMVSARIEGEGVSIMKADKVLIIGVFKEPIKPQQAASIVASLGDYLIKNY